MSDFETGSIIVANSVLESDPAFGKSVILLLNHSERGTIGVNLTRPIGVNLTQTVRSNILDGGPMEAPVPIVVHESSESTSMSTPIGNTGFALSPVSGSEDAAIRTLMTRPDKSFLVASYAGWGAGQLDGEAKAGFWSKATVSLDDLLSKPAEERWAFASAPAAPAPESKPAPKGPEI